jgi:uncharacterized phage-like protein YoqJ
MSAKAVFFTGHRPNKLGGYDAHEHHLKIQNLIQATVEHWYLEGGISIWISGMALGTDTIAALAVLEARRKYPEIKLVAAVPFPSQPTAWKRNPGRIETYNAILGQASAIYYVSGEPYHPSKMSIRNRFMVQFPELAFDNSVVREAVVPCRTVAGIAVYDGTAGGTNNCVIDAKKAGKEVMRIHPMTLEFGWI